jgi:phospholipase C
MNQAKISWKVYHESGGAPPDEALFVQTWLQNTANFVSFTDFLNDAAAGNLPSVSIVDPYTEDGTGDSQDEHPPSDPQLGQAWVSSVVSALMKSPNWGSTALFFSYDENGGFYDSVPPPPACPPDSFAPILGPGDPDAGFDRLGFRVPLIVVSPYAKRGYVSHTLSDHTSLMRFIEARFNLPALTARDANADPLFDMFDFSKQDLTVPSLPEAVVDPTELALCKQQYPDDGGTGL